MPIMTTEEVAQHALVQRKRQRLEWNEQKMKEAANQVAACLKDIHDGRLYEGKGYETFEAYCQKELGITRGRAYQILQAQGIRTMLTDAVPMLKDAVDGMSEAAVREIGRSEEPVETFKRIMKKTSKPKARDIRLEICPNLDIEVKKCRHCGKENP